MQRRLLLPFMLIAAPLTTAASQSGLTVEQKRGDLYDLVEKLQTVHPAPFRVHGEEAWEEVIAEASAELEADDDYAFFIALARVTALAADGHTRLVPWEPLRRQMDERAYPLRLRWFSDGLHVVSAGAPLEDLLGARVGAVAGVDAEEALERLVPVIPADNEHGARLEAAGHFAFHDTYRHLGLTTSDGGVTLGVVRDDGSEETLRLPEPSPRTDPDGWSHLERDAMGELPLWLARREQNYWFDYLEEERAVYVQFNVVRDSPLQPFSAFCDELFGFVEGNEVERLILDLRHNGGGNNYLNQPLVHGLLRAESLQEPGRLFVLTSPRTFSAAMNCSADLERNTQALFVGEPTGSGPNLAGDSEVHVLPRSGVRVRISELWWQGSDLRDTRRTIHPDLAVPLSFASYAAGEDPVLERALTYLPEANEPRRAPNTRWQRGSQRE